MRQNYFFEYVPNAYINLCVDKAQQMANNRFVYDFKAGDKEAVKICAEWLVRYLTKQYSSILDDFVVVFAPCSTQWKYAKRFGYLAAILNAAGIMTANEHVHIFGERKPTHNGGVLQEMAEGFYEAVAHSKRCFPQGVNIIKKSNNNYNKVA